MGTGLIHIVITEADVDKRLVTRDSRENRLIHKPGSNELTQAFFSYPKYRSNTFSHCVLLVHKAGQSLIQLLLTS